MLTSVPNFNFQALLIFEIKRVPKFNVGLLAPAVRRRLKLLHVLQVLSKIKQHSKIQRRISMHYAVMPVCIS